jgi:hypothetical protein
MRHVAYVLMILLLPLISNAGAVSRQYGTRFEGVSWGDSLEELVKKVPSGDHYFAYGGGQREYSVLNEKEMFGLSRSHMRVYYFFDESESVMSIAVMFPYEERMKLMGALTLSYGPYQRMYTKGISNFYVWPTDDGTTITVQETLDPAVGIVSMGISGPNSALLRKASSDCNRQSPPQQGKSKTDAR